MLITWGSHPSHPFENFSPEDQGWEIDMLQFGELVWGEFPYEEDGCSKNRWVMVLKDHGERVTVVYCTSNPTISGAVRLGALQDGKVTYVVPYRWETIQKVRLHVGRMQRVPLPVLGVGQEVLGRMKTMAELCLANPGANGVFPADVVADILLNHDHRVKIGKAQFAKIAARKAAMR